MSGILDMIAGLISSPLKDDRRNLYQKPKSVTEMRRDPAVKKAEILKERVISMTNTSKELEEKVMEAKNEVKDEILKAIDENMDKVGQDSEALKKELLEAIERESAGIQEKIHVENVKNYRNVQALLEEINENMANESVLVKKIEGLKLHITVTSFFAIASFLLLVAYVLVELGVIRV